MYLSDQPHDGCGGVVLLVLLVLWCLTVRCPVFPTPAAAVVVVVDPTNITTTQMLIAAAKHPRKKRRCVHGGSPRTLFLVHMPLLAPPHPHPPPLGLSRGHRIDASARHDETAVLMGVREAGAGWMDAANCERLFFWEI